MIYCHERILHDARSVLQKYARDVTKYFPAEQNDLLMTVVCFRFLESSRSSRC